MLYEVITQVQSDADHGVEMAAGARQFDQDSPQLLAVDLDVVGPLELQRRHLQRFERLNHGEPRHQGQAGRHRGIGIMSALFVLVTILSAVVVSIRQTWARIIVRVVGSWVRNNFV